MTSKLLFFFSIICLVSLCSQLQFASETNLFKKDGGPNLAVNNRILAKVNGKAISVVDVMKKMDVLFYREFPEYTSSVQARFQFYKVNWKHVLDELISKELVMADAEENKLPVSHGDVRQEMEHMFGPNIIDNLDKIGMSYDEAQKIVQGDITIRRMIYMRVNSKAIKKVTPLAVRAAYEEYAKNPENIKPDTWRYYVISIRDTDAKRGTEVANLTYELLNANTPLEQLSDKIKEQLDYTKTQINISEEYSLPEKDISEAYKAVLSKMEPQTHSKPIAQKSRSDKSSHLFRLFILKDVKKGGVPSFADMEINIKNQLLDDAVAKETEAYLKRLKQHFHVHEFYSTKDNDLSFEPFSLK